jgi:hypothetical protein
MANELRLKWTSYREGRKTVHEAAIWAAGIRLLGLLVHEWPTSSNWWVTGKDGNAPTGLEAMAAAESYALSVLREGVEALGGRVLDSRTLKRVIAALNLVALDDVRLDETREAARKLAKELGDGK